MKKRVFISFLILLLVVIIFSVIYLIYIEKRDSKISLKKEYISVEYGNTYNPNIDDLIDLSKYSFINKNNIRIESNIQNENEKDYPAVGKYEINVYYKEMCLKQKIEVIDTINPELSVKESIEIPFNTNLESYDFKECINATDLSQMKDYIFDFSNVNSGVSGEYTAKVSVEDIYGNKNEKNFKVIIKEENKKNINTNSQNTDNINSNNKKMVETRDSVNEKIKKDTNSLNENNSNKKEIKNENESQQIDDEKEKKSEPKIERCTNNSNHGISVGNSNEWFNTREEAISYYEQLIGDLGYKLEHGQMTREEYNRKCPYGYEVWSCMFCNKWTINFYFREK